MLLMTNSCRGHEVFQVLSLEDGGREERSFWNQLISGLESAVTPDHGKGSSNPLAELRVNQLRQWQILVIDALN